MHFIGTFVDAFVVIGIAFILPFIPACFSPWVVVLLVVLAAAAVRSFLNDK